MRIEPKYSSFQKKRRKKVVRRIKNILPCRCRCWCRCQCRCRDADGEISKWPCFFTWGSSFYAIFWFYPPIYAKGLALRTAFYSSPPVAASVFSHFVTLLWRSNIYFFSTCFGRVVWYIKSRSRLFLNLLSIVKFPK